MTFPLFKLPFLALRNVVLQMGVVQIVDLSFCSKKSRRIVSILARKQFHCSVHASDFACFIDLFGQSLGSEEFYSMLDTRNLTPGVIASFTTHEITVNGVKIPFFTPRASVWENMLEGCLFFAGYFISLFGIEAIEKMYFRTKSDADLVFIVVWLQNWKPIIKSFKVIWEDDSVQVPSSLLESLLQNLNVTENLEVLIPSRCCTISQKLALKSLELQSNCTFNSLLNVDCEDVKIGGISCEDLNELLLNWQNGGSQKLKKLRAKFKLDWSVLTNGITWKRSRNTQTVSYFSLENIHGFEATIEIIREFYALERYQDMFEFVVQQD